MSTFFNEATYEEAVIELFENMGYTHIHAPNMGRTDFSDPLLDSVLRDSLVKINKNLPLDAINEAIGKLRNFDSGSLVQKNVTFMNCLQNGVPVKYYDKGEERSVLEPTAVSTVEYTTKELLSFSKLKPATKVYCCAMDTEGKTYLKYYGRAGKISSNLQKIV